MWGWKWGHASQKASIPNCPPRHLHVVPLWKLSAWWTTEFSPVYANPTSLNKEEEGRMVKDTDAVDGVSVKTPGRRQRETTSKLFQRIWQNTKDDNTLCTIKNTPTHFFKNLL